MKEPILADKIQGKARLIVRGGLHKLRGNKAPYFTITADEYENIGRPAGTPVWSNRAGGCMHEEIETWFPDQFSDLIALHLSDPEGVPMHAEANGWHWLAKAAGIELRFGPDHGEDKCLEIFRQHCRIDNMATLRDIVDQVRCELGPEQESHSLPPYKPSDIARARQRWAAIMLGMVPRWKQEAEACMAKHGLVVYGDEV